MKKLTLSLALATTSFTAFAGGPHGFSIYTAVTGAKIKSSSFNTFAQGYNSSASITKKVGTPSFGLGGAVGGRAMLYGISYGFDASRYSGSTTAQLSDGGSRNFKFGQNAYTFFGGFLVNKKSRMPIFLLLGAGLTSDKLQISHTPGSDPSLYSTILNGTYKELGGNMAFGLEGCLGRTAESKVRLFYRAIYTVPLGKKGVGMSDNSKPFYTSQVGSDYTLWNYNPSTYLGDYIGADQHGLRLALGLTLDVWGYGSTD
ncbi:MAG: hypothetical protein RL660_2132 [Bacteroidota bacterium]